MKAITSEKLLIVRSENVSVAPNLGFPNVSVAPQLGSPNASVAPQLGSPNTSATQEYLNSVILGAYIFSLLMFDAWKNFNKDYT